MFCFSSIEGNVRLNPFYRSLAFTFGQSRIELEIDDSFDNWRSIVVSMGSHATVRAGSRAFTADPVYLLQAFSHRRPIWVQ